MGRGEKFYKYNTFSRDMSLSFKIVADSKDNLGIMYSLLNTLASSLAPTYTDSGYMAGNLHKLTVGNYIASQFGIINSLSYDIMEESPWEIEKDNQLPMYIAVSMKFTPIHNFRPESQFSGTHQFINQA
jgi:predicted outer membrane lipoprotein